MCCSGSSAGQEFTEHPVGADRDDLQYEGLFIRAHFAPDGELWATVHAFPAGSWSGGWKGIARESQDFALESATEGAEGEPCECCPQDLAFTPDGRAVLGYRNNIDNIRDMWVAIGDADGAFQSFTEVSDSDWFITYCPVQGPRLASNDSDMVLAWAEAAEGAYTVYAVTADASALDFSPPVAVAADAGGVQRGPTVAMDAGSRVWVALDQLGEGALLATSGDAGATWGTPGVVEAPDGSLTVVELAASDTPGAPVVLSGVTAEGSGWVGVLE